MVEGRVADQAESDPRAVVGDRFLRLPRSHGSRRKNGCRENGRTTTRMEKSKCSRLCALL